MAYTFHWPPDALLSMTADDLVFWSDRLRDVQKMLKDNK
ncbi:MAG: GpE family phage tail protein [Desulfovibrio sp.]|nr:GpE family phage tail protein [Desulfovibrio sp.]